MHLLSDSFALLLSIDPLGNLPIFVSLLKHLSPQRQKAVILRELLIALAIMIGFRYLGNALLQVVGISQAALSLASGLVSCYVAAKMLWPALNRTAQRRYAAPFIVPLATPLIAGPAVLTMIVLQGEGNGCQLLAIAAAWLISTAILLFAPTIQRLLGARSIAIGERLMGAVLMLLSLRVISNGATDYLAQRS